MYTFTLSQYMLTVGSMQAARIFSDIRQVTQDLSYLHRDSESRIIILAVLKPVPALSQL